MDRDGSRIGEPRLGLVSLNWVGGRDCEHIIGRGDVRRVSKMRTSVVSDPCRIRWKEAAVTRIVLGSASDGNSEVGAQSRFLSRNRGRLFLLTCLQGRPARSVFTHHVRGTTHECILLAAQVAPARPVLVMRARACLTSSCVDISFQGCHDELLGAGSSCSLCTFAKVARTVHTS